ncbi:MAG: hypothetical protein HRT87_07450 [Legionellales bacterium]|nr:hypothetical protein [Legionellales bacterium]
MDVNGETLIDTLGGVTSFIDNTHNFIDNMRPFLALNHIDYDLASDLFEYNESFR